MGEKGRGSLSESDIFISNQEDHHVGTVKSIFDTLDIVKSHQRHTTDNQGTFYMGCTDRHDRG